MRSWFLRAVREWPLWIALAAALSLFLLPRVARFGSAAAASDRLDDLRREVESGDPALAERRLHEYLVRRPHSDEAKLLRARATLARARNGDFPGAAGLVGAWNELSKAPRNPETLALRRETAALLSEYGLARDAVVRLRDLRDETRDAELALDLVPALARLAAQEPAERHALLDEGAARISDYLRVVTPDRRVNGLVAQARLYRESGRDEELAAMLGAELAETRDPQQRGRLHLERGRAFARLGKHREMEAMSSFDEAEKLLTDPFDRGLAAVHMATLYARFSNPACLDLCARLVAEDSPAAPLAQLVAGAFELQSKPDAGLVALRSGLARLRRPRMIDEAIFDFPWIYERLRAGADRESSVDRMTRFAAVWAEISRLRPVAADVAKDHAAVLLRARRFEEAAERFLAAGALLEAAEACAEGGLHLRAAALFRRHGSPDGLFRRAAGLKKAGDAEGARAGFEEYVAQAGPTGTFSGVALIEKASLQSPDEALATLDRVLKAREVATSPARDDWATALLGRGRALLRLSRAADARKVLEEYLERYAEGPVPAAGSVEAAWLLVGVAIEERQPKAALAQLDKLDSIASRIADPDAATLREARALRGELLLSVGDLESALRAFAAADDPLSGLIGRARALARLGRPEEARRDSAAARKLFGERNPAPGAGREYWEIALDALERELR